MTAVLEHTFVAPRDDLIRAVLRDESRAAVSDGRTMTGYPIVFDQWTEIHGWEGDFKERIAPGAVKRTLRNNADQVKVLFNHGMDPSIGDKPLGRASVLKADDVGVYLEVPLSRTSYNDDLLALIEDGAIDGMSFRFSVVQEEWNAPKRGLPERTITELKLFEVGPVTFPAYEATSVGLRSRDDFEAWRGLTDEKRAALAQIMGGATDLSTLTTEPADDGTSEDEARDETPEDPPAGHSEASNPNVARNWLAREMRRERARQAGVFT